MVFRLGLVPPDLGQERGLLLIPAVACPGWMDQLGGEVGSFPEEEVAWFLEDRGP